MGICWWAIYAQYAALTATDGGSGPMVFQGLYYLTSYFNQFGPNCTTWLVAGNALYSSYPFM